MEPNMKETINIKEETRNTKIKIKEDAINKKDMREDKTRNLNNDVECIKLGNRELFRDLSKSALVDTTLKKSGKDDN